MNSITKKTITIGATTLLLSNYIGVPTEVMSLENPQIIIRVGEYQNKPGKRLDNVSSDFEIDCPVRYENGVYSVREYDMNYKVANAIVKYLESQGVNVLLQDTKDKSEDLNGAGRKAKSYNPDIYLSIHHNYYNEDSEGYFLMYNQGDTQSEKYAKNISNALTSNPMLVPQRQNQANSGYIGELNQKPGDINLLAEMGFFSNPTECKKCVNDEQVDFIARTMGNELIQILNEINNSKGEMQLWQI